MWSGSGATTFVTDNEAGGWQAWLGLGRPNALTGDWTCDQRRRADTLSAWRTDARAAYGTVDQRRWAALPHAFIALDHGALRTDALARHGARDQRRQADAGTATATATDTTTTTTSRIGGDRDRLGIGRRRAGRRVDPHAADVAARRGSSNLSS